MDRTAVAVTVLRSIADRHLIFGASLGTTNIAIGISKLRHFVISFELDRRLPHSIILHVGYASLAFVESTITKSPTTNKMEEIQLKNFVDNKTGIRRPIPLLQSYHLKAQHLMIQ
uniref:Uncharacterized protein n=1 Tax=Glossina brevipalpis TaxID=37001 RepID=A0A1A9X5F7_9MUSC